MSDGQVREGLQVRSLVTADGRLQLSLVSAPVREPGAEEVLVRVEAAPINPSDLGLLVGPADLATAQVSGATSAPVVTAQIPPAFMRAVAARVDQSLPVGNEGAGVVIAAGAGPRAQALLGKTVAFFGGEAYSQYRTVNVAVCLALPEGATARDGASCFVNPLTALAMVEVMRREGHTALVHTAAASNLGQMLNKICQSDGVDLVNIVRSDAQADLLRGIGAKHVIDSSKASFMEDLIGALAETGATLAFDAIGGGRLASQILVAMEAAATMKAKEYSRYGSSVHKQVYIYGRLDTSPTELSGSYGMAWGVGGFLLTPFLQKLGAQEAQRLRDRVASELKTTFASHYTRVISLAELLRPEVLAASNRRATGEKYLINPQL
jgi:NADPH:quinone reductase-like Zn-dependent oxidoreductase